MAGAGPQRYPGASTAYFYQNRYGGDLMEVNVVVLHTTEGRNLPDYGGGGSAPNLTAVPDFAAKKLRWFQHFDIDRSSRALRNLTGGVTTNTNNVVQVELVGTCDPATRSKWVKAGLVQDRDFVFWPEAPAWAKRDAAAFLAWANEQHGVPLVGPSKWPAYPTSYADGGGQRMSGAQWNAFRGVCGHMHVPENDHGDPGAIDFAELLTLAKGATTPTSPVTQPTKPKYEPFPGASFFKAGRRSPIVAAMHKRLVAVGCNRYKSRTNQDVWGSGDVASYAAWQRKLGYAGSGADGIPGPASWAALKVPNV